MSEKNDRFNIYVDQLKNGHVEHLDETFDPSFLEVNEPDLKFNLPVAVKGDVYIAGDELVLHLGIIAHSVVPCVVCNTPIEIAIELPNIYETVPLDGIPHGIFSMQETLRQVILLNSKTFAECNGGNCLHRQDIAPYLKKPSSASPFDQLRPDDYQS